MADEVRLLSDGNGLAVIGDETAVASFLESEGLASRELGLSRLRKIASSGAAVANASSEIAANSGRWVKLTKESAEAIRKYGLVESKTPGISYAMAGKPGHVKQWLQITKAPGALAANPAVLTGAAGIMSQLAMQQAMEEITAYLARIDEKVDDVLRAQKDTVVAQMIGVGFVLDEAMIVREEVGRVSEVTWSKVQGSAETIAHTQAYALRQLDALAEKVERKSRIGDLADAAKEAESTSREWLAVVVRCFQLQDAMAVLELDRVLDGSPEDLDGHRLGLKAARQKRLDAIARTTESLLGRMGAAADLANTKVLLHPTTSPRVVKSSDRVVAAVTDLHGRLGIESGRESLTARNWSDAVSDVRDKAKESGAERIEAAKRLGAEKVGQARSMKGRIASEISQRRLRRGGGEVE